MSNNRYWRGYTSPAATSTAIGAYDAPGLHVQGVEIDNQGRLAGRLTIPDVTAHNVAFAPRVPNFHGMPPVDMGADMRPEAWEYRAPPLAGAVHLLQEEIAMLKAKNIKLEAMIEAMWDAPGMPGSNAVLEDFEEEKTENGK